MRRDGVITIVEDLTKQELEINQTKGREYAGDDDALKNFKECAKLVGIDPKQVCIVYMYKTLTAMASYAQHGKELSKEPITERVLDLRLYAALFEALHEDEQTPDVIIEVAGGIATVTFQPVDITVEIHDKDWN